MEETCCVVKERSIADKEQEMLSTLRGVKQNLMRIYSQIIGCKETKGGKADSSPNCLVNNVDMNLQLLSDITVIVNRINDSLF